MSQAAAAVLEPRGAARVALEGVAVETTLRGLLAETAVTQTYRNLEEDNIEAVYTFPLPREAVLLEMTFELGERRLAGVVQPRGEASARYEAAIEDGDTAVLLEQAAPGLYTVNVGNLLPEEVARVRFRYAQLLSWQGNTLRLHLPTTIAPRYGDPADAGLAPHQVPTHTLEAERDFTLSVAIEGALASAPFECPSHPVSVGEREGRRELRLAGRSALMDRDFVLVLRREAAVTPEARLARDGEAWVALASFNPALGTAGEAAARNVKLVIDCSGSMMGDSIAQARAALATILELLRPQDHFNIVTFGSRHRQLFPGQVPADAEHLEVAARLVDRLDADMGGTEIGAALDAAYASRGAEDTRPDVLLVTDGQSFDDRALVGAARENGHRVFTVGVGSAVSEAFLGRLAEETGGALELVAPREDMAERIVRQFRRMGQPRAREVSVRWGAAPQRQSPERLEAVYAGDTVHVFAWFGERPAGDAVLLADFADGTRTWEQARLPDEGHTEEGDLLPRLGAWQRLPLLDDEAARDVAVAYQLVSEHTACVLVSLRGDEERADAIPALRKVPQVLAAGWHGTGSVRAASFHGGCDDFACFDPGFDDFGVDDDIPPDDMPTEEMPLPTPPERRPSPAVWPVPAPPNLDLDKVVAGLNGMYPADRVTTFRFRNLSALRSVDVSRGVVRALSALRGGPWGDEDIARAFLEALVDSPAGERLSRHVQRLIRKALKDHPVPAALRERFDKRLGPLFER